MQKRSNREPKIRKSILLRAILENYSGRFLTLLAVPRIQRQAMLLNSWPKLLLNHNRFLNLQQQSNQKWHLIQKCMNKCRIKVLNLKIYYPQRQKSSNHLLSKEMTLWWKLWLWPNRNDYNQLSLKLPKLPQVLFPKKLQKLCKLKMEFKPKLVSSEVLLPSLKPFLVWLSCLKMWEQEKKLLLKKKQGTMSPHKHRTWLRLSFKHQLSNTKKIRLRIPMNIDWCILSQDSQQLRLALSISWIVGNKTTTYCINLKLKSFRDSSKIYKANLTEELLRPLNIRN